MATQAELWAAMECHGGKVRNLMESMETALLAEPVLMKSLRRKHTQTESIWLEIEGLYDRLHTMTDED